MISPAQWTTALLPRISRSRASSSARLPITAETCLHYLAFTAEEIADGATHFKCAPPIREASNRELLWKGLESGVISMVVSDHSPCTPALKRPEEGTFMQAWGGIAGLQLGLSVLWTLASARGHSVERMISWNTLGPATLAGLAERKGQLAVGFDADVVVWDERASFDVRAGDLRHKHPISPYVGRRFSGVVEQTFVGGRLAYSRRDGLSSPGGRFEVSGT